MTRSSQFSALLGLAIVLLSHGNASAAHWKEHECLADAAVGGTPETPLPNSLWLGAQELVGHQVMKPAPRFYVADWLPEHGVYDGQHLGGCFDKDKWALQIVPSVMAQPMSQLVVLHELAHAVYDDMNLPPQLHHCSMSNTNFHARAAKWLWEHNFSVNLVVIGAQVLNEYAMCQAAQNG